jgi:hypothetical protein
VKNLSTEWTRHLRDENERKSFSEAIRNDTLVLTRLQGIIREKLDVLAREEETEDFHDSGYPFRQPFNNGRRAGLKDILRLLDFMN